MKVFKTKSKDYLVAVGEYTAIYKIDKITINSIVNRFTIHFNIYSDFIYSESSKSWRGSVESISLVCTPSKFDGSITEEYVRDNATILLEDCLTKETPNLSKTRPSMQYGNIPIEFNVQELMDSTITEVFKEDRVKKYDTSKINGFANFFMVPAKDLISVLDDCKSKPNALYSFEETKIELDNSKGEYIVIDVGYYTEEDSGHFSFNIWRNEILVSSKCEPDLSDLDVTTLFDCYINYCTSLAKPMNIF